MERSCAGKAGRGTRSFISVTPRPHRVVELAEDVGVERVDEADERAVVEAPPILTATAAIGWVAYPERGQPAGLDFVRL